MKRRNFLALVLLLLAIGAAPAEQLKAFSKEQPVQSVAWGALPTSFVTGYLEMARAALAPKFAPELVEKVISACTPDSYPAAWKVYPKDKLKLYAVGTFENTFGGRFRGLVSVLWVPYDENKELWVKDSHLKPYDFFLLVDAGAVKL